MKELINILKQKIREGTLQEMCMEAKWMLLYARHYYKMIIFYIFLGMLSTGMGFAGSIAFKYLIDAVTGYDTVNIGFIISVIISMAMGGIIVNAIAGRISTRINLRVHNEIQADVYDKIMNADWELIVEYHSGDLLNRLTSDVSTVASCVIGWIPSLITKSTQFIGTLIIILYYDLTMAILALMSAPITLLLSKILVNRMRNYNKKMREVSSDIMVFQEESFQNILTIKCFGLVKHFGERFRNIQKRYINTSLDYNKFSIYISSFMSIIGTLVYYSTFGWGVYRLWSGFITYGTMTLFLQLSGSLSNGFSALVGMIPSAIGAATAAGRIMAIAELPREIDTDLDNIKIIEQKTFNHGLKVQLTHIDFMYRGRNKILHNVSMYAEPQEIVAIIGKSGEGKTTLIRLLLGLLRPTCGKAKLIDHNGVEADISNATRRFFAYVPQGNTIFSGSIAENLRMVKPEASDEELILVLKVAYAYDFIKNLSDGIYTKIGEKGCGLSEGQAQRLSIARALLREAPILLLDEATSALDIMTEMNVLQSIMAYGKTRTCILTTHRQSVLEYCDRIYKIHDNQIYEYTEGKYLQAVDY